MVRVICTPFFHHALATSSSQFGYHILVSFVGGINSVFQLLICFKDLLWSLAGRNTTEKLEFNTLTQGIQKLPLSLQFNLTAA